MAAERGKWVVLGGENSESNGYVRRHWPVNEPTSAIEKGSEFEGAGTRILQFATWVLLHVA